MGGKIAILYRKVIRELQSVELGLAADFSGRIEVEFSRQDARIGVPLTGGHCAPAAGKHPDFAVLLGESAFHPVKSQRGHRHVRDLVGRSLFQSKAS